VANPQVFGPAAAERAGTHPVSDNRCHPNMHQTPEILEI
jgi:hypothetical protein